jgi:hypothetical protein
MFIRLRFHVLLSTQELLLQHGGKLLSVVEPLLKIWHRASVQVKMTKRMAIYYLEGRMAQGCVICCVILEFYQAKSMEPLDEGRVHNTTQIHLQTLI